MRRILNLNQPSLVFLKWIALFTVLIPAVLYLTLRLLREPDISSILFGLIGISFAAGAFVFIVLVGLIILEQIQDHYLDVQYHQRRDHKLPLADGNYECQYCGNRKVKEIEKTCWVCGRELK